MVSQFHSNVESLHDRMVVCASRLALIFINAISSCNVLRIRKAKVATAMDITSPDQQLLPHEVQSVASSHGGPLPRGAEAGDYL